MTITYNAEVASIKSFGVFWKLLCRWKGSIYKLVWPDLTLYIVLYFTLNMSYRFAMNENHRQLFEEVAKYCANFSTFIPMSFVLGFYVTIVVNRWWEQYMAMPWPDSLAVYVSTNIHGNDDRGRLVRRTIMRYVNLAFVYTMSQVCTRVKKRFPTLDHLVEAGIMTETERKIFEIMNKKTAAPQILMPLVWAGSIVTKARKEGRIRDDFAVKTLVDSINAFRSGLGNVLNYDWIFRAPRVHAG
ncbi:bestrophin-2-like, partial [Pollicipes pollicipes]|uniref:bestrophin-2-like n=1 Tax=Pollicipes pollicipes TaxID=41117 RepID=UPI00188563CE